MVLLLLLFYYYGYIEKRERNQPERARRRVNGGLVYMSEIISKFIFPPSSPIRSVSALWDEIDRSSSYSRLCLLLLLLLRLPLLMR